MAVVNGYDIEIWAQLHGKPCYYSCFTELYCYARLSSPQFIVEISNKSETFVQVHSQYSNEMKRACYIHIHSLYQKLGSIYRLSHFHFALFKGL